MRFSIPQDFLTRAIEEYSRNATDLTPLRRIADVKEVLEVVSSYSPTYPQKTHYDALIEGLLYEHRNQYNSRTPIHITFGVRILSIFSKIMYIVITDYDIVTDERKIVIRNMTLRIHNQ